MKTDERNKKTKNQRRIIDNEYENEKYCKRYRKFRMDMTQKILSDSTIFQKFVY